jgi:hypothetical protein
MTQSFPCWPSVAEMLRLTSTRRPSARSSFGTRGPSAAGFTTVRIELFVDDAMAVHRRALGAGAVERSPVKEHTHETIGPKPIKRILQGALVDPFVHMWLIGNLLD